MKYMLICILFLSSCINNKVVDENERLKNVSELVDDETDKIGDNIGKISQNDKSNSGHLNKLNNNNASIDSSANSIKQDISSDTDVGDETKKTITSKADVIINLNRENEELISEMRILKAYNENLLSGILESNSKIKETTHILSVISKNNKEMARKYKELLDKNAELYKEKLYLIIIISVIAFGVSVAFMMNPETTRWGKFGAVSSLVTTCFCLALVYYGKVGAIISGVVLVGFLVYIIKHITHAKSLNRALDDTIEVMERGKYLMDDSEESRVFGKTDAKGLVSYTPDKKLNRIIKPRVEKVKAKINNEDS